mmetsp:Transcript_1039/g.2406  ORF Transcript_1039/g.2406 Transcript_1039/m.2406 type:complete len:210 (-) Transcript_1039:706-1335(-)
MAWPGGNREDARFKNRNKPQTLCGHSSQCFGWSWLVGERARCSPRWNRSGNRWRRIQGKGLRRSHRLQTLARFEGHDSGKGEGLFLEDGERARNSDGWRRGLFLAGAGQEWSRCRPGHGIPRRGLLSSEFRCPERWRRLGDLWVDDLLVSRSWRDQLAAVDLAIFEAAHDRSRGLDGTKPEVVRIQSDFSHGTKGAVATGTLRLHCLSE